MAEAQPSLWSVCRLRPGTEERCSGTGLYAADGDELAWPELAAEQLDEAGALSLGERNDGLGRADVGEVE